MELRSRARDRSTHRLIYHQLLVTGFTDGGESRRKEQGALSYAGEVTDGHICAWKTKVNLELSEVIEGVIVDEIEFDVPFNCW